ncbi:hypothetical protein [Methanoregula sp.]|uniref:hypothetical protein n=1 Tax=Methanoregula sp. TaxID=2052170 RepID=UPI003C7494F4
MTQSRSVKGTITGLAAAQMITGIYIPVLPAILPLLIAGNGYSYSRQACSSRPTTSPPHSPSR